MTVKCWTRTLSLLEPMVQGLIVLFTNIDCYERYSKISLPGAFSAKPRENRTLRRSPRETSFTGSTSKTSQYLFYNILYTDYAQFIKRPATINQTNT